MISASLSPDRLIQIGHRYQLESFMLEVTSYLGQLADVYYFTVSISASSSSEVDNSEVDSLVAPLERSFSQQTGLLRIGNPDGALERELRLRADLKDYKLVSRLLAQVIKPIQISLKPPAEAASPLPVPELLPPEPISIDSVSDDATLEDSLQANANSFSSLAELDAISQETKYLNEESLSDDYLEEEYLEAEHLEEAELDQVDDCNTTVKLILLSELPDESTTLETWLKQLTKLNRQASIDEVLSFASQLCQFFRYVYQRGWCSVQFLPRFIQVDMPIKVFDLTTLYPVGQPLPYCILDDYSAPELAYTTPNVDEKLSTYVVGALLYRLTHLKTLQNTSFSELAIASPVPEIAPIPALHQLLKICLSQVPDDRFPLTQLLTLLLETRQAFRTPIVRWQVGGLSTVGLSVTRLQNEDNYGIRQHTASNGESLILAAVADGMGGMAEGEVASQLAIKTILEATIPADLTKAELRSNWLLSLVQQANSTVTTGVREGGTTLSVILALQQELMIAHVGDSRIYLLRKGQICQLSEDHSMVAMMVASGKLTYEDSQNHPDKNVLTKSLGSKPKLSDGYIQTLDRANSHASLTLEDGDILLLCSDGTWDLVPPKDFVEYFEKAESMQAGVNQAIAQVLTRGAHDNATLIALRCQIQYLPRCVQGSAS